MKRSKISKKASKGLFRHTALRTKAVNVKNVGARGGIRM